MSFRLDSYAHEQLARQRAEELGRKAAAVHRLPLSTPNAGRVRTPVAGALRAIANRISPQIDPAGSSQSGVLHTQLRQGRQ